jgi:cob(I)alamin adenosyltransferase
MKLKMLVGEIGNELIEIECEFGADGTMRMSATGYRKAERDEGRIGRMKKTQKVVERYGDAQESNAMLGFTGYDHLEGEDFYKKTKLLDERHAQLAEGEGAAKEEARERTSAEIRPPHFTKEFISKEDIEFVWRVWDEWNLKVPPKDIRERVERIFGKAAGEPDAKES